MGVYDEYAGLQLKVGPCQLGQYALGDKVPIDDGVYVAWGGVVVIRNGLFVAAFEHLLSKWGDVIDPEDVLTPHQARHAADLFAENQQLKQDKIQLRDSLEQTVRMIDYAVAVGANGSISNKCATTDKARRVLKETAHE